MDAAPGNGRAVDPEKGSGRAAVASTLIVAHRARSGEEPENTLAAVDAAVARGVEAIEVDARITADGIVVVCHDATVGGRVVATSSHADLLDANGPIPTLREVAGSVAGRCLLDVEVKEPGYEEQVADAVSAWRRGGEGIVFTSFHDVVVARLKALCPSTRAGLLLGLERPRRRLATRASELRPLRRVRDCSADLVAAHYRLLRFGLARRMVRAGYPVWVWTVDEPRLLGRLLADPYVAAIITDDPVGAARLREA